MRRTLALATIAVLALGATPAPTVTLPVGSGAWAATLQRVDGDGNQTYLAIDSTGNAERLSSLAAPGEKVAIDPTTLAKIDKAVEGATLGRWYLDDAVPMPVQRPLIFQNGTGDTTVPTNVTVPAARLPLGNIYVLTVQRRTVSGAVETGRARWLEGHPTAEPTETFDIASTLRSAFQTRIASTP